MLKKIGVLLAFTAAILFTVSLAQASDIDTRGELESLRSRLEKLEGKEAGVAGEEEEESRFSIFTGGKSLTFWGSIEVEASYDKIESGEESSDIVLATAQLGTDIQITDRIGGHIVFLFEEDDTEPIAVDEGNISIHFNDNSGVALGRLYVPFGNFNSHMISDPFTLELGETSASAIVGRYGNDMFEVQMGVFNGDIDTADDTNNIDTVVASLRVTPMAGIESGVSYIGDLTESNSEFYKVGAPADLEDNVAGIAGFISLEYGNFYFDAEIVGALDDYTAADVSKADDLTGEKPSAWNLEFAMTPIDKFLFAVRYEETFSYKDDLSRYGVAASYSLYENTALTLEYLLTDPLAAGDNIHTVTTQLAMEF